MSKSVFLSLVDDMKVLKLYRGESEDPRDFPAYTVSETAAIVNIHPSTLSSWLEGKDGYGQRKETFEPLIQAARPDLGLLSFYNVVEAHLLRVTRKEFSVPMLAVRRAMDYVQKEIPDKHPLITREFRTDGKNLFVREVDKWINASKRGQLGIAPVLDLYLQRIKSDDTGFPFRLYPVSGTISPDNCPVMIDPSLSSGGLVIAETRILVITAWERLQLGETYEKLARDYRIEAIRIKRAIEHLEKAA